MKQAAKRKPFRLLMAMTLCLSLTLSGPAGAATAAKNTKSTGTTKKTGKSTNATKAGKNKKTSGSTAAVTRKAKSLSSAKVSKGTVTVKTAEGKRTYKDYTQRAYGYSSYGCVLTAVSIASSGMGMKYNPRQILTGSSSQKYSVRYALKKLKFSSSLINHAALSMMTANKVLSDMGIPTKVRYSYKVGDAVKEITQHLQEGKPVILKASNNSYRGARIATGHHAIVLVSLEKDGTVVFIDPMTGRLNYAHRSGNYLYCSVKYLLQHHCRSSVGNVKVPFVTNMNAAGGYILVG